MNREAEPKKKGKRSKAGGQDHHFVPCFYTKRWTSGDPALLTEFKRRVDGQIRARRTSPKGTGYAPNLYGLNRDSEGGRNRLENEFFAPVDTRAADALRALEAGISNGEWNPGLSQAWSSFIMSLLMRMPQDLEILRRSYTRELAIDPGDMDRSYRQRRQPHWPESFADAIATLDEQGVADSAKVVGTTLIGNKRITNALSRLYWAVADVRTARKRLLTSDRPVQRSAMFTGRGARVILPIGPSLLFIGAADQRGADAIIDRGPDRLVASSNRAVIEAAESFAYGLDDTDFDFVRRHFGLGRPKPLLQELAEYIAAKRGN